MSVWQTLPKQKKAKIFLAVFLVLAASLLLWRAKYKADTSDQYTFSGKVTSESDGSALSGVKVTFISGDSTTSDAQPLSATSADGGAYSFSVPKTDLKNATLTFTKDGFYDQEGGFNFSNSPTSVIPVNLALKSGFGREDFVVYLISPGFNTGSLPFEPGVSNPQSLLKYAYSVSGTNINTQETFRSPLDLYLPDKTGNLAKFTPTFATVPLSQAKISAGDGHSLAIKNDGTVSAWGLNNVGQLGDGTNTNKSSPVTAGSLDHILAVSSGEDFSLALKDNGTVFSWGSSSFGQMGVANTSQAALPTEIAGLSKIVSISAGSAHALALDKDGNVYSWGNNQFGQLGDGTTADRQTPIKIPGLSKIKAISAGSMFSLAIKDDGTVYAWGHDNAGQLCNGVAGEPNYPGANYKFYTPKQIDNLDSVQAVSAGQNHTLILKFDGSVFSCGLNRDGQLGDGTTTDRYFPTKVANLENIKTVSAGQNHSLALKTDNTVFSFGNNAYGQLGDGKKESKKTPTQIPNLTNVSAISGGYFHSIVETQSAAVFSFGDNQDLHHPQDPSNNLGKLGVGSLNPLELTPKQIPNFKVNLPQNTTVTPPISQTSLGQGQAFYFQNNDSKPYFITAYGKPALTQDFTINLGASGNLSHFGNPLDEPKSTVDVKIIDIDNSTHNVNDAISKELIDKNLVIKTGPGSDNNQNFDMSNSSPNLVLGRGFALIAKKDGLKIKFEKNPTDSVEIPSDISIDDAEWASWVDRNSLNDETYGIWENIAFSMVSSSIEKINNEATENDVIDENNIDEEDLILPEKVILFTKNGKIIPSTNNISSLPTPTGRTLPGSSKPSTCFTKSDYQSCAVNSLPPDTVTKYKIYPWPNQQKLDWFMNTLNNSYPKIIDHYGPALSSLSNPPTVDKYDVILADFRTNRYGGVTWPNINVIALNKNYIRDYTWTDKIRLRMVHTLIEETLHSFRDDKIISTNETSPLRIIENYYASWEYGQAELITSIIMKECNYVSKVPIWRIIEAYKEIIHPDMIAGLVIKSGNKPMTDAGATTHWIYNKNFELSAAAWEQIYSQDPNFLKIFNSDLVSSTPYIAMKNAIKESAILKGKIGVMSVELDNKISEYDFNQWYLSQWGALPSLPEMNYTVENDYYNTGGIYRHAVISPDSPTQSIGEEMAYRWVYSKDGVTIFPAFKILSSKILKTTTQNGLKSYVTVSNKQNIQVNQEAGYTNKLSFSGGGAEKKKFTFLNVLQGPEFCKIEFGPLWNFGLITNWTEFFFGKRNFPFNVYAAIPGEEAGIYGVVDELHTSPKRIKITPLKPQLLEPHWYDVKDGYFQTTWSDDDKPWGWNAGTYKINYISNCGKTLESIVTKGDGKKFLPITVKPHNYFGGPIYALNNKINDKLASLGTTSADEFLCYSNEMKIENVSFKTLSNNSGKLTFSTTHPAYDIAQWGETKDYEKDLIDPHSDAGAVNDPQSDHEITFQNIEPGKTYYYNLIALDSTGENVNQEGEFSIISINNAKMENVTSKSVRVSWDTIPDAQGTVEFSTSSDFSNVQPAAVASETKSSQSVIASLPSPNTTYYLRIHAYLAGNESGGAYHNLGSLTTGPPLAIDFYGFPSGYRQNPSDPYTFPISWYSSYPMIGEITVTDYLTGNVAYSGKNSPGSNFPNGGYYTYSWGNIANLMPNTQYVFNLKGYLQGSTAPDATRSFLVNTVFKCDSCTYHGGTGGAWVQIGSPDNGGPFRWDRFGGFSDNVWPSYSPYVQEKGAPEQSQTLLMAPVQENLTVSDSSTSLEYAEITLDWSSAQIDPETESIGVFRAVAGGQSEQIATVDKNTTKYVDKKLKPDTVYDYKVIAKTPKGDIQLAKANLKIAQNPDFKSQKENKSTSSSKITINILLILTLISTMVLLLLVRRRIKHAGT